MSRQRTILVTGSSSGIGEAIVGRLLADGHRVIGVARRVQVHDPEHAFKGVSIDLSAIDDLPRRLARVVKDNPSIDGVISCAGAGLFEPLESVSADQVNAFFRLNLLAHVHLARVCLPHLKKIGLGDFIFMGSESALRGAKKGALYCTAKFGLRGLAQSLRAECSSKNVRVSLINPGVVRSPFFEQQRFRPGPASEHAIEPSDVADVVSSILTMRPGTVIDEVNLTPLKHVLEFD
ncbi:MAG: SDR family oxidoreductase [Myxococcota bacterium]|nr:SDR family oxidoreductase [Myxococcota bacterium]